MSELSPFLCSSFLSMDMLSMRVSMCVSMCVTLGIIIDIGGLDLGGAGGPGKGLFWPPYI